MSKLNELIQELCPNGVEYRKISSFTKVLRGKRLTKDKLSEENSIPVYHGGIEPLGYYGKANRPANMVMIINVGASAGTVAYSDKEFWSSDGCFCIDKNEEMDDRYLYHYLKNNEYYFMSKVRKAGIPTLDNFIVEEFKIPVPPLEVQREIVHILDSFTLLTAELTAELTARKKQYEYYRDTLLTFNDNNPLHSLISRYCPNGVEYKKIGDIAFISTGSKLRDIQESHSLYEYINAGTTNSGYSLDWNCDGDVVTTPSRGQGGIGYVGYQKNKFWLGPLCYKIVGNADFVLNKYLYYYLSNNSYEILSLKKDGGVPAINKSDLEELILSVPPLEVQRQIVQILDRFDTICSDLNIGLPAEIEARQKQYEFYRDKLLSFKQL
ncbi:restriction endonuclease subunit S [Gardnerella sp. DNF01144]|uniref:restriction endonuclease subunit S n=1 Tax=Gardnerella sp. DNF01144 TaxID=2749058 RepID=UPI003BAD611B